MTGHTPIRLFLTAVPFAASETLLETLRRDFQADLRLGAKQTSGAGEHAWGKAVIGETEISIEVDFLRDASQAESVFPVVLLHSEAYEAAFDSLRGLVLPRGKEALIEFCLRMTAAVHAEGFRLEFAGDEKLQLLTINGLIADLTSNGFTGLVQGIALTSPLLSAVKAVWPLASERGGYLVLDFI